MTLIRTRSLALQEMPSTLRRRIEGRTGLYSAAAAYAPGSRYDEGRGAPFKGRKVYYHNLQG
jgi:hypothetical protein